MEVRTHKLDRGSVNVFGSVTDVMLYWYAGLYIVIWWFSRAFIGIQLIQLAFPILVLIPVHFTVVAFLETPYAHRVMAAFRFGFFTADRYLIAPDPNPLLHVIERLEPVEKKSESKTRIKKQNPNPALAAQAIQARQRSRPSGACLGSRQVPLWDQEARKVLVLGQEAPQARQVPVLRQEEVKA